MSLRNLAAIFFCSLLFSSAPILSAQTTASAAAPKLIHSVDLPGYTGDFDHFALDLTRSRVLLSAEDHGTLEVFDLATSKHLRTVTGFDTPHSILVRPGAPTIFVTDSGKAMSKLLSAATFAKKASVPLVPGADSIAYDSVANVVYVVTGGKDVDMKTAELAAVNPDTGKKLGSVTFDDNHVEALALEANGPRLFINLAQTNKLAVVDRKAMKVIAMWPIPPAEQNAMVRIDEAAHRLFVVCRKPGMVVVLDSDTGKVTNTLPAPFRSDDLLYDQAAHRIYVPGGDGNLAIYDSTNPDALQLVVNVPTMAGAKTGLLLPDKHLLFLAASPGDTKAMAKVLTYQLP